MQYLVQGPRLHIGPLPYASARRAALYQSCLAWNAGTIWLVENRPSYPTVQAFENGRDVTREIFDSDLAAFLWEDLDDDSGGVAEVRNPKAYH